MGNSNTTESFPPPSYFEPAVDPAAIDPAADTGSTPSKTTASAPDDHGNAGSTRSSASTSVADSTVKEGTQKHPENLDVVFLVDCTASMGSYIKDAQKNIRKIMEKIIGFEKTDARFGLVAYRDHPPQDQTFVTRTFDFTKSRKTMQSNVDWMSAQGGGDGPEAVAAGLKAAVDMCWRKEAAKIIILIADAPPHGLGESGDGFPNGCPDGNDPLELAQTCLDRGIVIYPVGCEPALGSYRFARDFMVTLANITQGQAVTLSSADLLADVIIGGAQEEVALERIMEQVADEVEHEQATALAEGGEKLDDMEVCSRVQTKLASRGTKVRSMKHNAKMDAPHADMMRTTPTLAAWRTSAPAPPAPPEEDLLCDAMSFSRARPLKGSKSSSRSRSRSRSRSSSSSGFGSAFGSSAAAPLAMASKSAAATEVSVEDSLISTEQVMRAYTKGKARKGAL